jgi:proton-coupled amino acid transporter
MAIFFSFPLSVYPCIRIVESWIFGTHGGKQNLRIKWLKNLFRAVFVVGMGFVAFVGSNNLDYFVSLVGSVSPPLFGYSTDMILTSNC